MSPRHIPTSVQLSALLEKAGSPHITVAWLIDQLEERSFGLTLLVLGLLAMVPGASTIAGVVIAWPAIQMILGHRTPVLPGPIARRTISVERLGRAIRVVAPRLRWLETLIRPRWHAVFRAAKRPTGILMLLLGLTMISPLPFSHMIPALVVVLLALAFLEEDGVVLLISLMAALTSFAITAGALWGAVETADWLDRM